MTESDLAAPQTWFFVTHRDSGSLVGFNGFAYAMEGWGEGGGGASFSIPKTPLSIEPLVMYDFQAKAVGLDLSAYLDF